MSQPTISRPELFVDAMFALDRRPSHKLEHWNGLPTAGNQLVQVVRWRRYEVVAESEVDGQRTLLVEMTNSESSERLLTSDRAEILKDVEAFCASVPEELLVVSHGAPRSADEDQPYFHVDCKFRWKCQQRPAFCPGCGVSLKAETKPS